MLETLDAIDWKNLTHAHGEASDVPQMLRALASDHPGRREGALDALFSTIWHQGSVYPASAAAVPFLIELVGADAQQDLAPILELLMHLATGASYLDAHQHHDHFAEERAAPDFAERLAEELRSVEAAKQAVAGGAAVYARLLRHPEASVRVSAAYLLGLCPGEVAREALRHCLENDAEPAVRAVAGFALGAVADASAADHLRTVVLDPSEHPAVRLYAGFGLAERGEAPGDAALAAFVELVDETDVLLQIDELHESAVGTSYGSLADSLLGLPEDARARLVPALGRALEAIRGRDGLGLATALLGLAFGDTAVDPEAGPSELTTVQQKALASVVRARAAWASDNMALALGDLGFTDELGEREGLAEWLGVELPEDDDEDEEDDDDADDDDDDTEDEDAGVDVDPPDPDDAALGRIARFAAMLDGEQWREAKQWFGFFQQMRGTARVEPPAMARWFGARANLEAGYWLYDRDLSRAVGSCVPLEHIRLAIGHKRSDEHVALRIRVDEDSLEAVLAAIVRHQDDATPDDFTALALALLGASPEVLLETGRAQRARLGKAAGSA